MNFLDDFNLKDIEPDSFKYKVISDNKRIKQLKNCLLCKSPLLKDDFHPLCKNCYSEKVESFPEKYFPKKSAFKVFSKIFDDNYKNYDKNKGFIIINRKLPFSSPFSVLDIEATGNIRKDRAHFIITMGILYNSRVQIYQLIDFKKRKEFFSMCKRISYTIHRPAVAYNFYGAERFWLKQYSHGWIDIKKDEVALSKNGKITLNAIKLNDIVFKWDDITGKDCIEECVLYQKSGDLIHMKKIAYHNFIDLLKEYLIGLTNIEVHDYLKGKMWDYNTDTLRDRFICPRCYFSYFSKEECELHLNQYHKKKKKGKRVRKR